MEVYESKPRFTLPPDTSSFLDYLGGSVECYMFMKPGSKEVIPGLGTWFGDKDAFLDQCSRLSDAFEPHILLNLSNLKGRKKSDIVGTRTLCVDLDRQLKDGEYWKFIDLLQPQFIVESSPGKCHFYWPCSLSLNDWRLAQGALAFKMKGDLNFIDIHKTIRIPGFERVCKDGSLFTPTIIYRSPIVQERIVELDDSMRLLGQEAIEARRKRDKELSKKANKVIATGPGTARKKAIKEIGAGERNSSLYQICKEFVIKGNGTVTEESTIAFGVQVNSEFDLPLDEAEAIKTAVSAYKAGEEVKAKRQEKYKAALTAAESVIVEEVEVGKEAGKDFKYDFSTGVLSMERYSGDSIVARVQQKYYGQIVRCLGLVLAWDNRGSMWKRQKVSTELIDGMVKSVILDCVREKEFIDTHGQGKDGFSDANLSKARCRMLSNGFIAGCVSRVLDAKEIEDKDPSDFDADKYVFSCENGVLDLITTELRVPKPSDLVLQKAQVSWIEDWAKIEEGYVWWENFLVDVFSENDDCTAMVKFMQELFGYSISGAIDAQKLFCHYGQGSNGKSKVLDALATVCGAYSTRMGCMALSKSKHAVMKEVERMGAKLEGRRVVILDDLDVVSQWNEGFVKSLTSTTIPVRRLYEEEKDIPNRTKFHIGCNELPSVETENFGIMRRICIIKYKRTFEPNFELEKEIQAKITKYRNSLLYWAVIGLQRVLENENITYPAELIHETTLYREKEFSLETACMELFSQPDDNQSTESLAELLNDVQGYYNREGIDKKVTAEMLGKTLAEKLNFQKIRVWDEKARAKITCYRIKLNTPRKNKMELI